MELGIDTSKYLSFYVKVAQDVETDLDLPNPFFILMGFKTSKKVHNDYGAGIEADILGYFSTEEMASLVKDWLEAAE